MTTRPDISTRNFEKPPGWQFDYFSSSNGYKVRYGHVRPDGAPRGTVVVTTGYGRHIEYYYEMINNWRDRGYAVFAMDWAGQGGSEREEPQHPHRPPTMDFGQQARILHEFTQRIVRPDRSVPAFLVSHSQGGNIVLRYMQAYENRADYPYDGAVLATPLVDINTSLMPRAIFNRLVRGANRIGLDELPIPSSGKLYNDFISAVFFGKEEADPERDEAHERHKRDTEHYHLGYPTAGWFAAAIASTAIVRDPAFLQAIRTPTLILTADKDSLVSVRAQEEAALYMPHAVLVKLHNAKHGLWYDTDRVQNQLWHAVGLFTAGIHARHENLPRAVPPFRPGLWVPPRPPAPGPA